MAAEAVDLMYEDSDSPLSSPALSVIAAEDSHTDRNAKDKPDPEKSASPSDQHSSVKMEEGEENAEMKERECSVAKTEPQKMMTEESAQAAEVSEVTTTLGSEDSITVGGPEVGPKPKTKPTARSAGVSKAVFSARKTGLTAQAKAAATRKAKAEARKWEAPFVLTDEKSPLGGANLRVGTSRTRVAVIRQLDALPVSYREGHANAPARTYFSYREPGMFLPQVSGSSYCPCYQTRRMS
jgi:hypothetical protein